MTMSLDIVGFVDLSDWIDRQGKVKGRSASDVAAQKVNILRAKETGRDDDDSSHLRQHCFIAIDTRTAVHNNEPTKSKQVSIEGNC